MKISLTGAKGKGIYLCKINCKQTGFTKWSELLPNWLYLTILSFGLSCKMRRSQKQLLKLHVALTIIIFDLRLEGNRFKVKLYMQKICIPPKSLMARWAGENKKRREVGQGVDRLFSSPWLLEAVFINWDARNGMRIWSFRSTWDHDSYSPKSLQTSLSSPDQPWSKKPFSLNCLLQRNQPSFDNKRDRKVL